LLEPVKQPTVSSCMHISDCTNTTQTITSSSARGCHLCGPAWRAGCSQLARSCRPMSILKPAGGGACVLALLFGLHCLGVVAFRCHCCVAPKHVDVCDSFMLQL
jgi:hypothetical protein